MAMEFFSPIYRKTASQLFRSRREPKSSPFPKKGKGLVTRLRAWTLTRRWVRERLRARLTRRILTCFCGLLISLLLLNKPKSSPVIHGDVKKRISCRILPSGGNLFIIWAWNHTPCPEYIRHTLEGISTHYPDTKTTVLCGSDACIKAFESQSMPCMFVERLVVPELTKGTPMQSWAEEHVLAKLLSAHLYELQLQVCLQLVVIWKYGGIVLLPGIAPSESMPEGQWIASESPESKSERCSTQSSSKGVLFRSPSLPGANGLSALSGNRHSFFALKLLKQMQQPFLSPYHPSRWPVSTDWKMVINEVLISQDCCIGQIKMFGMQKRCARVVSFDKLNLKKTAENETTSRPHHYATLSYNARRSLRLGQNKSGMNIAEEIQGLAGIQFLPYLDAFVERDRLEFVQLTSREGYRNSQDAPAMRRAANSSVDYSREQLGNLTTVFLNARYPAGTLTWPPPPKIDPILVGMHLNRGGKIRDKVVEAREYLISHGPVGSRDLTTHGFFYDAGIPALFSGCMTLTLALSQFVSSNARKQYVAVDVSEELLARVVPERILFKTIRVSQDIFEPEIADDRLARYYEAYVALRRYSSAKLVITERIEVVLPCVAVGTPVILLQGYAGRGAHGKADFGGLLQLGHTFDISDHERLRKSAKEFDWRTPPSNPGERQMFDMRNRLRVLSFCNENIRDAARKFAVVPKAWSISKHVTSKNCKMSSNNDDAFRIATTLDGSWFHAFPTWLNAIATTNSHIKIEIYVFTNNVTATIDCLLSWMGTRILKNGALYVIPVDEILQGKNYNPSPNHRGRISITTQARLYLSTLLPCVDKVLWIDLDAIVLKSLKWIWDISFGEGCGVMARTSLKRNALQTMTGYLSKAFSLEHLVDFAGFNAGVMLISLDRMRAHRFEENIVHYFTETYGANDQVVYNLACNGSHIELPAGWNIFGSESGDVMRRKRVSEWGIFHFTGRHKPHFLTRKDIAQKPQIEYRLWERFFMSIEDVTSLP